MLLGSFGYRLVFMLNVPMSPVSVPVRSMLSTPDAAGKPAAEDLGPSLTVRPDVVEALLLRRPRLGSMSWRGIVYVKASPRETETK